MTAQKQIRVEDLVDTPELDRLLRFINSKTPHRFTGICRVVGKDLKVFHLVDKFLQPINRTMHEMPLRVSFALHVLRDGEFFCDDCSTEKRLLGNPFRDLIGSYVGVSLEKELGLSGCVICHYDIRKFETNGTQICFLKEILPLLSLALTPAPSEENPQLAFPDLGRVAFDESEASGSSGV